MDAKRAEYLMNVARKEQHKAFLRWTGMPDRTPVHLTESARLDCAEWAIAGDELYKILEQHHKENTSIERRETPVNHA